MAAVCGRLHGAFTLVAVDAADPDRVVAARRSSPLVVGLGDGENFLGSDVAAFVGFTRRAMEIVDNGGKQTPRLSRAPHRRDPQQGILMVGME